MPTTNPSTVPELHHVLTPDEVLAGYRDAARDPAGWWLAVADDQPAGVLLLNGDELTFLGVVPERRGRGIGRRLLELALERAADLSLIVDARNAPAFQLYQSAGFEVVGAREVFLYFPPPAAGTTGPKVPPVVAVVAVGIPRGSDSRPSGRVSFPARPAHTTHAPPRASGRRAGLPSRPRPNNLS